MKRNVVVYLILSALLAATALGAPSSAQEQRIVVGVLLDVDGSVRSGDAVIAEAVRLAARDVAADLERIGRRLEVLFEDTDADPRVAAQAAQELADRGARFIVGPTSSPEARAVLPVLERTGVVAISMASTAVELALDDNLMRFVSNDAVQVRALSHLYAENGIDVVVPFVRADEYGLDLLAALRSHVASPVHLVDEVVYEPGAIRDRLGDLEARVSDAVRSYGARRVAVQYVGFDELVEVAAELAAMPALSSVRWFGADALAVSPRFVASKEAAAFGEAVDLIATIPVPRFDHLRARQIIQELLGAGFDSAPLAYALNAYDAMAVAALAESARSAAASPKEAALVVLKWFSGVTGKVTLDENGDRADNDYYFVRVARPFGEDSEATWTLTGHWAADMVFMED